MGLLSNCRVLVVEDEFLIAASLCEVLRDASATVVGPCYTVQQAVQALRAGTVDAAILDMNLHGEWSDPVAEDLVARGIPFVFTTGYRAEERAARFGARIVAKPYDWDELVAVVADLVQRRPSDAAGQDGVD